MSNYKVGDPVKRHYSLLGSYGGVCYIRRIAGNKAELAQEIWPFSHFVVAELEELKPAKFTKKQHKKMKEHRARDILDFWT